MPFISAAFASDVTSEAGVVLAVAVAAAGDVHVVIDAADGDGGGDGGVVKLHTVSLFHQVI